MISGGSQWHVDFEGRGSLSLCPQPFFTVSYAVGSSESVVENLESFMMNLLGVQECLGLIIIL